MRDVRKKFWISPFQTQLFLRVGMYWLIYTFTLFNFLFGWRLLQEGAGDLGEQFLRCAADNVPLFLCLVLLGPWLALDAVRFSNHLVGPLYRFKVTLKTITNNEPVNKIKLRKGDFLLDMQDQINDMIEALQSRGAVEVSSKAATGTHVYPLVGR